MDENIELPPVPMWDDLPDGWDEGTFTERKLRDYARTAVLAERERCARVAETFESGERGDWGRGEAYAADSIAAAIRKG